MTVTVNLRELGDAHTHLYTRRSAEYPDGHLGGAFCPCSLARAMRQEWYGDPRPWPLEGGVPEWVR